jgi:DHA1 family bicyclomycin/chloramphenicol resistance-like MFS transporter
LGAALATSIEMLWFWRAVQGAVAGVGMTVGRAVVRDVADGPAAQRMLSQTTMMFALAPAIAPVIGGWLHALAGWRAIFIFLSGVAVLLALFCWRFLPETLPPERRQSLRPRAMAQGYAMIASHGPFLRLAAALGFNFVGFFLYVLAAPEFLVRTLGVPTTGFAWLFLPCIAGTMLGAFASSRLAGRLRPIATIRIGYAIMFASVGVNLLLSWLLDPPRVPWITLPLMGYNIGMALAMAPLQVMLLDMFDQRRGMASSGMAFAQSSGNAVVAGVVAPLLWHAAPTMALGSLVALSCGAALFAWQMHSTRRVSGSS